MKAIFRKICIRFLKLLGIAMGLSVIWVAVYKFIPPPITGMMFYKWCKKENYTITKEWKSLEEISVAFPLAVIAAEDQKFLDHNGFDVAAIQKAIDHNKHSDVKRGASTISQQVAKNVFLFPTKSYLRKGLEVYFTALIELIWGKRRIAEVYINIVELGEGIYGIESASRHYFDKPAQKLSDSEAALIAITLPNPIKYAVGNPTAYMKKRREWVLKQMNNLGGAQLLLDWYE